MDAILGYASSSESDEKVGDPTLAFAAGEAEGGETASDSDDSQEAARQQQDCKHHSGQRTRSGVGSGHSDGTQEMQEMNPNELTVSVPPILFNDKKIGTYPTFVYAAMDVPDECKDALARALAMFQERFPDLQAVEPVCPPNSHSSSHKLDFPEEASGTGAANAAGRAPPRGLLRHQYHISLSRPATVRYPQIDGLVMSLREFLAEALSSVASSQSGGGSHEMGSSHSAGLLLEMSGWDVFANDDRSKSFIASAIPRGCGRSSVIRAIRAVDRAFLPLDLPLYYSSPMPHVSLGWLPGDHSEELRGAAEDLMSRQGTGDDDAGQDAAAGVASWWRWRTAVDEVCCMIGERVYTVWPWPQEQQLRKKPRR